MPASSGGILPSESLVGPTESQLPKLTAEAIYSELRDRICLLDLPPGAALRDQHLAEEFGVSRTPVREALAMLRLEGLAVRRAGGGTSVSTVDIKALRDVYALRLKLTELIADFTKARIPPDVLERLGALRGEVEEAAPHHEPRELGRIYSDFHAAVLETVGNDPLKVVLDRLFRQTARIWIQLLPEMDWDEEVQILLDEIDGTIQALEDSSPARMAEIRAKHMMMLLDRFNDYLTRPVI